MTREFIKMPIFIFDFAGMMTRDFTNMPRLMLSDVIYIEHNIVAIYNFYNCLQ